MKKDVEEEHPLKQGLKLVVEDKTGGMGAS